MRVNTQVGGGDRLQNRLSQLQQRLTGNSGVLVGVPKGAGRYEDGTLISVIAAVHEFGSVVRNIPERSFLRVPLRSSQDDFKADFRKLLPMVTRGELTMFQLLSQIGARAAAVSQEAMAAGIPPPNDPATIRRKGSSTPLIDTGRLRQSITYEIEDEDD